MNYTLTDDDAQCLLRYGLIVDALAIVAVAAVVASGCYARAAHGRVDAAYRSGYEAGCNDTIERLLPSDAIPCEPWGPDDEGTEL